MSRVYTTIRTVLLRGVSPDMSTATTVPVNAQRCTPLPWCPSSQSGYRGGGVRSGLGTYRETEGERERRAWKYVESEWG